MRSNILSIKKFRFSENLLQGKWKYEDLNVKKYQFFMLRFSYSIYRSCSSTACNDGFFLSNFPVDALCYRVEISARVSNR